MAEASKTLTAFSVSDGGHFYFEMMPFGFAPATFQRFMSQNIDDVIVIYVVSKTYA